MIIQSSSFRDNHGFVFLEDNILYRTIRSTYRLQFEHLKTSGLYQELLDKNLIVKHEDVENRWNFSVDDIYKIIKPEKVQFISYPYEWCQSQLKAAALTTLQIQKTALEFGMVLKDSSAFNIQFHKGAPILIDTLSFDFVEAGRPWIAYKQFCEHFLGPILLMTYVDPKLNSLFGIEGISISLANKLLPLKRKLNLYVFIHLTLHAKFQNSYGSQKVQKTNSTFTIKYHKRLADNLLSTIRGIKKTQKTFWQNYYDDNVEQEYFLSKRQIITDLLLKVKPRLLWDIGANDGEFSRIAAQQDIFTVSLDSDPSCVEENYRLVKENNQPNLLPLLLDYANPTPAIGWSNLERDAFLQRNRPDVIMMLAVLHHLTIHNAIPLAIIASQLSDLCSDLIIEFIPKEDKKVEVLLQNREDVFIDYSEKGFERIFGRLFDLKSKIVIKGSSRIIYHWLNRNNL